MKFKYKELPDMRFFSTFIISMLFSATVYASEIKGYPLDKIASNTYVVHGPLEFPNKKNKGFMNNPGFVVTNTGVVVIDPGSTVEVGRMLLKKIKEVTNKPVTHVLNTHIHGDHWLGNQAFAEAYPKAIIMAHPDMIKRAKAGDAEQWVSSMLSLTEGESKGTRAVIPDKVVTDQQVIQTGGVSFRIYAPEKAHSFTDIMIEVVEERVVFLGDNVLYKRLPRMDDGTFVGNIKACDVALKISADKFVPGHGPSGDKNIITPFKEYLNIVYTEAGKHYEEGLTDFQMKPKILLKLKPFIHWAGFEEVGKHISLAVLEYEKNAF